MTNEQINAGIAEACGWGNKPVVRANGRGAVWVTEWPDYCADLNAMHEAEKVLGEKRIRTYAFLLAQVLDTSPTVDLDNQFLNIHATARQRAEAFLRTLGKWESTAEESSVVGEEVQP